MVRGNRHIVIVGAGPGGLTAAMILAKRGFRVTVCEKESRVGGRNGELVVGNYHFDLGPTFLMMKFLLDEMFAEAGRQSTDYLNFLKLDPMYELRFDQTVIRPTSDTAKMRAEIDRVFPGQGEGFERFLVREKARFHHLYPCLQQDYSQLLSFLRPSLFAALPHLSAGKNVYEVLSSYFEPEQLRIAFTFQSKYLGMSPWTCPGLFTMIPYIEYAFGVYHVMGGLCRISEAMARVVEEHGGEIRLGQPVRQLNLSGRRVTGVTLEDGQSIDADEVVVNADFAHAMTHLLPKGLLRKYREENLYKREYSCSTFMLYLGVDKCYHSEHHVICFAKDYRRNLREITDEKVLSQDVSFYIRNASVNDPKLAPPGHSALYVLVPVPNNASVIDWEREAPAFRDKVVNEIEKRTTLNDLSQHIVAERMITPVDWQNSANVFLGATFNLAHTLRQMLYFRPHNRFEELDHCYLVGGGTHPGSGLPTIYESGRISANLISQKYAVPFAQPQPLSI